MSPPKDIKELQRLNRRVKTLNRFLSKSSNKSLPLFRNLRKQETFCWDDQCQKSFEEIKKAVASPPVLAKPLKEEALVVYLSMTDRTIGSVLVVERERSCVIKG